MRKIKSKTIGECPCEYALRYIGGAWKILIVVILDRAKIRRHAELKRVLVGVTPKMLTQQQPGRARLSVVPQSSPAHRGFSRWRAGTLGRVSGTVVAGGVEA